MALDIRNDVTVAVSAGTNLTYNFLREVTNAIREYVVEADSLLTQRTMKSKVQRPTVESSAPNGYTQARNTITFLYPRTLANGNRAVDKLELVVSCDVETSAANKKLMLVQMIHAIDQYGPLHDAIISNTHPDL